MGSRGLLFFWRSRMNKIILRMFFVFLCLIVIFVIFLVIKDGIKSVGFLFLLISLLVLFRKIIVKF